jgi:hypothetical protein
MSNVSISACSGDVTTFATIACAPQADDNCTKARSKIQASIENFQLIDSSHASFYFHQDDGSHLVTRLSWEVSLVVYSN